MTSRVVFLTIFLTLFSFLSNESCLAAETQGQEFFPFLAEVTSDRVNVRAGQSANFEKLCMVNKGDEVVVLEHAYGWYKIELPREATSFIISKYVEPVGRLYGLITNDRINIRAGAGINYSVLGQLNKGDKVRIVERQEEWYKIRPVKESFGWVSDQFLTFKSNAVVDSSDQNELEKIDELIEKKKKTVKKKVETSENKIGQDIVVQGHLKPLRNPINPRVPYQLFINGNPAYFLKGEKRIFRAFDAFKVSIEGKVIASDEGKYPLPLIDVANVRIVL